MFEPKALSGPDSVLVQLNNGIETKWEAKGLYFQADIVAIHGLLGDLYDTWRDKKTQALWLKDFLPHDIPMARILTYSYPSAQLFDKSQAMILTYALKLLEHLYNHRRMYGPRPIIFVAHSLGGIVCKKALILAKEDARYHDICSSTAGILFFGTPHGGPGSGPDIEDYLRSILIFAEGGTPRSSGEKRLHDCEGLKANSEDLGEIINMFHYMFSGKLKMVTIKSAYAAESSRSVRDYTSQERSLMLIECSRLSIRIPSYFFQGTPVT